jgi:nucleotide-binding universal stress UspA family protein
MAVSERAQLLVVGAHNHHGLTGRLLGSVSLHCAQHARCRVLVIRDHSPMP